MQTSNQFPEEPEKAKDGSNVEQSSQPFYEFPEEDLIRQGLVYPPPPSFYQQAQTARNPSNPLSSVSPVPTNPGMEAASTLPSQPAGYVPPGNYGPPLAPAPPMQPPAKKSRKWIWISVSILVVLLLAACGVCGWAFSQFVTPIVQSETDVINTSNSYYAALQDNDYAGAYQYLAPQGAIKGMTQTTFTQRAQSAANQYGAVRSYTTGAINVEADSNTGLNISSFTVVMNVTRTRQSYNASLTMQKSGNTWKIVNFDRV